MNKHDVSHSQGVKRTYLKHFSDNWILLGMIQPTHESPSHACHLKSLEIPLRSARSGCFNLHILLVKSAYFLVKSPKKIMKNPQKLCGWWKFPCSWWNCFRHPSVCWLKIPRAVSASFRPCHLRQQRLTGLSRRFLHGQDATGGGQTVEALPNSPKTARFVTKKIHGFTGLPGMKRSWLFWDVSTLIFWGTTWDFRGWSSFFVSFWITNPPTNWASMGWANPGLFFWASSAQQGKWYFGVATRNTPARTNRFFSSKRLAHQIKQHPRQEKHWKLIIWYA